MAANTMDTNSNSSSIPKDILFEILTMLPVKSLCRFKCVSKSWLSILSDPKFVDAHFSRSKLRPKLLISVSLNPLSDDSSDSMSFYSIEFPEEHHESSILHATAHGSIKNSLYSEVEILMSSASGLICCNCYQGIIIGNPITRKFNLVIEHPEADIYTKFGVWYLGFDPIDKRQVLLKLYSFPHVLKSSVFTLGNWHDIPPPQPFFNFLANNFSICINGVIYFICWVIDHSMGKFRHCLYAFDVRSECFELIQHDCTFDVQLLTEYKGCAALVCSGFDEECSHLKMKLWMLEDRKKNSWSCKSFAVRLADDSMGTILKVGGITHRDELVFAAEKISIEGSFDLFLYKIDTGTVRRFTVCGFGNPISTPIKTRLDFLTESLYSPN